MRRFTVLIARLMLLTALLVPAYVLAQTAGRSLLDVDGNGVLDVATDIVYIGRDLLGLTPVPPSFRQTDPTIPPDATVAANVATAAQLPGTGLVVRDRNGVVVGPVVHLADDNRSAFVVAQKVGAHVLTYFVNERGFVDGGGVTLSFENAGCTGPPMIQLTEGFSQLRSVQVAGTTGYYANGPGAVRTIRAFRDITQGNCVPQGPFNLLVAPVATIDLAVFPAPFSIDLL